MTLEDMKPGRLLNALIDTGRLGDSQGLAILKRECMRRMGSIRTERNSQAHSPEMTARRRAFAIEAAASMEHPESREAWKANARRAKEIGLYSPTTYLGDIASSLWSYARRRSA